MALLALIFIVWGLLEWAASAASVGYEDSDGFHYGLPPGVSQDPFEESLREAIKRAEGKGK